MSEDAAPDPGVELVGIQLLEVNFRALGGQPDGDEETPVQLGIGTKRPTHAEMIVMLTLEVDHKPVVQARVAYTLHLRLTRAPADVESFWRRAVARLAPTIALPYFRDLLHSLGGRSGVPLLLPVRNYGAVIDPDTLTIAPPPDRPAGGV